MEVYTVFTTFVMSSNILLFGYKTRSYYVQSKTSFPYTAARSLLIATYSPGELELTRGLS